MSATDIQWGVAWPAHMSGDAAVVEYEPCADEAKACDVVDQFRADGAQLASRTVTYGPWVTS